MDASWSIKYDFSVKKYVQKFQVADWIWGERYDKE